MNTTDNSDRRQASRFPQSVLWTKREEFTDLELVVKEGQIPTDIYGYAFFNGAVGSTSKDDLILPSEDGSSLFNGDGMIYRLDFDQVKENKVKLSNKLAKTPCFYTDRVTFTNDLYADLKYRNLGLARLSFGLGFRNQVNTALLPMKFSQEKEYRLLATWDAGRPYEIDTKTLELVTPIGWNKDWQEQINLQGNNLKLPFGIANTTAHPIFDPYQDEGRMFAVNYGKSIKTWLRRSQISEERLIAELTDIRKVLKISQKDVELYTQPHDTTLRWRREAPEIESESLTESDLSPQYQEILQAFRADLTHPPTHHERTEPEKFLRFDKDLETIWDVINQALGIVDNTIPQLLKNWGFTNFVHLVSWDGKTEHLNTWEVVVWDEEQQETAIEIKECMHQIGVTEKYIVLADTVFKLGVEQLLTSILPNTNDTPLFKLINEQLRNLLSSQQADSFVIYIINRADLQPETNNLHQKVIAKRVEIPKPAAHFFVDYENIDYDENAKNCQITLHVAHNLAWDPSVWIRPFDKQNPAVNFNSRELQLLPIGMSSGGMDINQLGKYAINGETGEWKQLGVKQQIEYTWMTAIAAYNIVNGVNLPKQFKNIYWISWGCWADLLSEYIVNLYKQYDDRILDENQVVKTTQQGLPVNICRLNAETMEIADSYSFPANVFGNSLQFVPRKQSGESNTNMIDESMNGYIVCIVNIGDNPITPSEFWIFDAANLQSGPVCKLTHEKLKIGMTVHSTWLPEIGKRQAKYYIPVAEDYQDRLPQDDSQKSQKIRQLFQTEVYPHFQP